MLKSKVNEVLMDKTFLDAIHEGQRLKEDLMLDSLSLSELALALENAFDIVFSMDDVDPANFGTVADVYALMEKYVMGEMKYAV